MLLTKFLFILFILKFVAKESNLEIYNNINLYDYIIKSSLA